jgi:hypothetical protein
VGDKDAAYTQCVINTLNLDTFPYNTDPLRVKLDYGMRQSALTCSMVWANLSAIAPELPFFQYHHLSKAGYLAGRDLAFDLRLQSGDL